MSMDKTGQTASTRAPVAAARHLLHSASKASLGTIDRNTGYPFVSLVLIATEPDGTPLLLVSRLAVHTKNLANDARASLLIDVTGGLDDPMTGERLTLTGQARPTGSTTARGRFLTRHASAQAYADFPDFAMYAFEIETGHYVGGFGRIVDIAPSDLLRRLEDLPAA